MCSNQRKNLFKSIIQVLIVFIFILATCSIVAVRAENTGGGSSSSWEDCPTCQWIFTNMDVRLSLYKYDGQNLSYFTSVDYCSEYNGCPSGTAYQHPNIAGKVAHQKISSYQDTTGDWVSKPISIVTSPTYPSIQVWDDVEAYTLSLFDLTSSNKASVLAKLKTYFPTNTANLTESDLEQIYITIEPTFVIKNTTDATLYYGTAYELAAYFNGEKTTTGLNGAIYYDFPRLMMAQTTTSVDAYHFIGTYVQLVTGDELSSSTEYATNRQGNASIITSEKGYGINVFWLGSYVSSCTITQNATTGVYNLNISGNTSGISYGISNVSGTTNGKLTYTAMNSDTMIYGTIKNSNGDVIDTCSMARTPLSCTITKDNDTDTYQLNISGSTAGISYGISNVSGTTNGKLTYTAINSDTMIYGTIKNNTGEVLTTCNMAREIPTCPRTCAGKTGDDLLSCAESFCQSNSGNSSDKKTCIVDCGYDAPSFSSCSSNQVENGEDTECEASTTASKITCAIATTQSYYKTTCTESSTIKYDNTLPTELSLKTGFRYEPILSGTKTCEMTFEIDKWKFDYASAYTDAERTALLNILKAFQDTSSTSIWMIDENNIYKYQSNDATMSMVIKEENVDQEVTTVPLDPYKTINLLQSEINIESSKNVNIPLYANGNTAVQSLLSVIKTTSSNETTYRLQGVCVDSETLEIYDMTDNRCNKEEDGPYYQYFIGNDIEKSRYNTYVSVSKMSSNLNVNNTCYYSITEEDNPSTGDIYVYAITIGLICTLSLGIISYRKLKENKKI